MSTNKARTERRAALRVPGDTVMVDGAHMHKDQVRERLAAGTVVWNRDAKEFRTREKRDE